MEKKDTDPPAEDSTLPPSSFTSLQVSVQRAVPEKDHSLYVVIKARMDRPLELDRGHPNIRIPPPPNVSPPPGSRRPRRRNLSSSRTGKHAPYNPPSHDRQRRGLPKLLPAGVQDEVESPQMASLSAPGALKPAPTSRHPEPSGSRATTSQPSFRIEDGIPRARAQFHGVSEFVTESDLRFRSYDLLSSSCPVVGPAVPSDATVCRPYDSQDVIVSGQSLAQEGAPDHTSVGEAMTSMTNDHHARSGGAGRAVPRGRGSKRSKESEKQVSTSLSSELHDGPGAITSGSIDSTPADDRIQVPADPLATVYAASSRGPLPMLPFPIDPPPQAIAEAGSSRPSASLVDRTQRVRPHNDSGPTGSIPREHRPRRTRHRLSSQPPLWPGDVSSPRTLDGRAISQDDSPSWNDPAGSRASPYGDPAAVSAPDAARHDLSSGGVNGLGQMVLSTSMSMSNRADAEAHLGPPSHHAADSAKNRIDDNLAAGVPHLGLTTAYSSFSEIARPQNAVFAQSLYTPDYIFQPGGGSPDVRSEETLCFATQHMDQQYIVSSPAMAHDAPLVPVSAGSSPLQARSRHMHGAHAATSGRNIAPTSAAHASPDTSTLLCCSDRHTTPSPFCGAVRPEPPLASDAVVNSVRLSPPNPRSHEQMSSPLLSDCSPSGATVLQLVQGVHGFPRPQRSSYSSLAGAVTPAFDSNP